MLANFLPPATGVGAERDVSVPSPSIPPSFPPQQYAVPSLASAQVCRLPTVSDAKVNATRLPAGWQPVGGTVGEGGAFVLACRTL